MFEKKTLSDERVKFQWTKEIFATRTEESETAFLWLNRAKWELKSDLLFLIKELHNLGGIASFRANVVVHSIDLIPSALPSWLHSLKDRTRNYINVTPPLIPRDHRIRLNLEFLSFLYKLSWLDNSRPNTILGNCTPLNEKNSFKTSS